MPSTRLLTAALAASAALAAAPAAHADSAALTVTALGGPVPIGAQTMADGSVTLPLPHDGVDRDVYLDATSSIGGRWFTFDTNGDGQWDDYGYGGRKSRKLVSYVLRQDRVSAVDVLVGDEQSLQATLRWRVAYMPEARLTAPRSVEERHGATFDASDSIAWNSATVQRPVARFEWDVEDGAGFARTTTSATFVKSFKLLDHHACVRVRAVDVSGARSAPAEACTTVTPALFHPRSPSIRVTPPPVIVRKPGGSIPKPGPVERPSAG